MNVQMPEELFLDTFVGDVPSPLDATSNEIPQEGLYNQYSSATAKETIQTYNTPFIHVFTSGPLASEYYVLPYDVVIFYINIGVNAGGAFACALDDASNLIIDGSVGGNIAIPQWYLRKGQKLYSSVLSSSIKWVGIILNNA